MLLVTAFLTAYYTFRLYFRVFEGPEVIPPEPDDHPAGIHRDDPAVASESAIQTGDTAHSGVDDTSPPHHQAATAPIARPRRPRAPQPRAADHDLPAVILAVGAVLAGYLNFPKASLGRLPRPQPVVPATASPHAWRRTTAGEPTLPAVDPDPSASTPPKAGRQRPRRPRCHTLLMVISGLVALAGVGLAYLST